jgi:hypothetical protein
MTAANPLARYEGAEGDFERMQIAKLAAAKNELATEQELRRYRIDTLQESIQLQLKRHEISQRDADVQRMVLADTRAQENSPEGNRIRAAIVDLANARQLMREAEIMNAGTFSTRFAPGRVSFAALNQDRTYGSYINAGASSSRFSAGYVDVGGMNKDANPAAIRAARDTKIFERIATLLESIDAKSGSLN